MAERQKNQLTNEELIQGWDFVAKRLGFPEHEAMFAYGNNKNNMESQIRKHNAQKDDPEHPEFKDWRIYADEATGLLNKIPRVAETDEEGRPVYIEAVCNGDAEKAEKRKELQAQMAAAVGAPVAKMLVKQTEGDAKDAKTSDDERNKERGGNEEDTTMAAPNPKIEVFVPDDDGNYPDLPTHTFEANDDLAAVADRALQEYSWTDTVDGAGSFSFSVENEAFGKDASNALAGKMLFDAIKIRSVVKICETNSDKPNFVGIIRDKSVSSEMGSGGVRRRFSFSGDDIMSVVFEYELFPLNVNIADESLAVDLSAILSDKNKKDWSITDACNAAWDFFQKVANEGATRGTTALAKMLGKFAGNDFFKPVGQDLRMQYTPTMPLSPAGANPFGDILRKLFPSPYYLVFSQTRDGKPSIWFFAAVFLKDNYNAPNMKPLKIEPRRMKGYNLTQSDRDMSTVFMATVNGMMMTEAQARLASDGIAHDQKAKSVYGQKLCTAAVWGHPTSPENFKTTEAMMKNLAEGLREMYAGANRFAKGTITILAETAKDGSAKNPSACSRISCLGGDFFVRSATHSWRFGGPHLISLSVEKGCVLENGGFDNAKPLENLGTIRAEAGE